MPMSNITTSGACAGAMHRNSSCAIHSPDTGPMVPNLHAISCISLKKYPAAMTVLPPFTVPRDGTTPVTRGISSNMKLGRTSGSAAVDPGCVTSSAYAPDSTAGTSQWINADDTTNAVTPTHPNLHCTSSKTKCRPVICTTLPPPLNATSG